MHTFSLIQCGLWVHTGAAVIPARSGALSAVGVATQTLHLFFALEKSLRTAWHTKPLVVEVMLFTIYTHTNLQHKPEKQ